MSLVEVFYASLWTLEIGSIAFLGFGCEQLTGHGFEAGVRLIWDSICAENL